MYFTTGIFFLVICVLETSSDDPTVRTSFGAIRGKRLRTNQDWPIAAYLGVPYAEPPVGPLRFKSPQPWRQHWTRIRDGDKDGNKCVQLGTDGVEGSEDCLNLNIFVPEVTNERKLPVMVFVHGGSFRTGSNNSTLFAPTYLLNHQIILVTVNYRLGILGFLSSGSEALPGNYGLKDVVQALKWIQANIEDFGGDPRSVTLSGQSAGAALVHHLSLSQRTEGLFNKFITQSGSANAPWAIHNVQNAKTRFIALGVQLGCAASWRIMDLDFDTGNWREDKDILEDDMKIVECLRKISAQNITEKLDYFHSWGYHPYVNFGPTIEPEAEDAIITKHPMVIIERGEFRDIPWLTTVTANEGLHHTMSFIADSSLLNELINNFDDHISSFLEAEEIVRDTKTFMTRLDEFYSLIEEPKPNEENLIQKLSEMASDGLIIYWSYEALNKQSSQMNSSVFFGEFAYEGTYSGALKYQIYEPHGVMHSDDVNYLFPIYNVLFADLQLHNTLKDITMINIITESWANFVKTGIPSARLTPYWQEYQQNFRFMKLGAGRSPDISMKKDFLPHRMEFWQVLMTNVSAPREELFPEPLSSDAANPLQENTTYQTNSIPSNRSNSWVFGLLFLLQFLVSH